MARLRAMGDGPSSPRRNLRRLDAVGLAQRQPHADWPSIVLLQQREAPEAEAGEVPDKLRQMVEGVGKLRRRRRVAPPEARVVRVSDNGFP